MDRLTKPDKVDKSAFAKSLYDAFMFASENKKLGVVGRHESEFAKICGTSVKNIRRWFDGDVRPQRRSWAVAKAGLKKIIELAKVEALDDAWSEKNVSSIIVSPASTISEEATRAICPFDILLRNPFPKICFINLEIPNQASGRDDFIVQGELRFARAPDVVDGESVSIGVRRAVLLPELKNCYVKPRSLHRPRRADASDREGATQVVFQTEGTDPAAVLEGDQLRGEMLGRFLATGAPDAGPPEVAVLVQLETPEDLRVTLKGELIGRSESQKRLAEIWVAREMAKTVQEPDGSLRIGECVLRWKRLP